MYMSFYCFPWKKGFNSQAKFLREQLNLRGTCDGIVNFSCNPGSKLSPVACAVLSSVNFLYRIMLTGGCLKVQRTRTVKWSDEPSLGSL